MKLTAPLMDRLLAWRWPLFFLGLMLALLAWPYSRQVKFDHAVERMFAPGDPLLPPYERLKARFGGNEVVLLVYEDPQLLQPAGGGLARLKKITTQLKAVPGVQDVLSLAEVNALLEKLAAAQALGNLFGLGGTAKRGPPLLDPDNPLGKNYLALFEGYTHSADGRTVAAACLLDPSMAGEREATIAGIRKIAEQLPDGLAAGQLAGEPVMVAEGFRLLELDGARLGFWSTLLLGATIFVCFRSLRWLAAPILVVQWTLLVTQASLVLLGLELSMVSSMLTAIVTVVGVATTVHLIVRTRELQQAGAPLERALAQSATVLALPILGACLTDAAGFGALWFARVGPVQDFGVMMAIGSLWVIPAVLLLVPAAALAGEQQASARPEQRSRFEEALHRGLTALLGWLRRRSGVVAAAVAGVSLVTAAGAYWLEVETDFTNNFRPGSPIVRSYAFVEERLGGAGVFDVVLPAPARLDEAYLERVRRLERALRAIPGPAENGRPAPALTKVISLVDALDAASAGASGLLSVALPRDPELKAQLLASTMPVFLGALRSPGDANEPPLLRIMLRAHERQGAADKTRLIAAVERCVAEEFPPQATGSGGQVTGFFVLLTNLIESLLADQWTTFAAATLGIAAMLLLLFRSLRLTLIALVPNALPIFLVMGLLGWLGLKVNMGAAMIAAVSMGMSVDSSIHYLHSYLLARRSGLTHDAALADVQSSVGRAMIFSTLALVVGFAVLCTSEFVPTIYFGALVCLAMLGGLAGNLVIMPLLLSWSPPRRAA